MNYEYIKHNNQWFWLVTMETSGDFNNIDIIKEELTLNLQHQKEIK